MPIVDPVIERVLADFERRAEDEQRRTMAPGAPAADLDDLLLSVGRDAGILLYLLATGAQSRRILELGTSYGYSTVWLGAAARATGGKVMSLENKEFKIEHARQALTRAGLSTRVEFHAGDCLDTLRTLPGPFDFVLLDVWKDLYLPCFELIHPKLSPGGIIAADNMLLPESVRQQAEAYRARVRTWRGGDVRAVYYTVLAAVVVWGIIALKLAAPVMLLQIGANIAGVVFIIASIHVLYLNTRVLPVALRPPMWRRVALVGMVLFYGFFVTLVARSLLA